MKILFSARPAYGHIYPMMPLACAAREAGHEVEFATAGSFLSLTRDLGFSTHVVGLTIEEACDELAAESDGLPKGGDGRPDMEVGGRLFIDVIGRRTAADLVPVLDRARPDLVIYEQYEFGAPVAAAVAGLQAVCHTISPQMPEEIVKLIVGDRLERLWGDHGVSPAPMTAFTGETTIDIFPSALQPHAFLADPARIALRPIPWAEPSATVPRWVGCRHRPLVYLTLGTIVATDEVLTPAIEGLATFDADVLVALGSAAGAELGTLPGNVHVEAFVDQAALMPYVDLVVHHGGSGTVLAALAQGKPQVLLPKGADQFLNADLMATTGLASVLEPKEATPDAVATMAKVAMEEQRPAVDLVRVEIAAMPDPADVVAVLAARFG